VPGDAAFDSVQVQWSSEPQGLELMPLLASARGKTSPASLLIVTHLTTLFIFAVAHTAYISHLRILLNVVGVSSDVSVTGFSLRAVGRRPGTYTVTASVTVVDSGKETGKRSSE
jgi:hypothetical protein